MRVKRYIVETMPDAMQKIRTDLGKDAVILSTKEVRIGGFLGMFGKKKIEVVAAVEQAAAPNKQPASRPVSAGANSGGGESAALASQQAAAKLVSLLGLEPEQPRPAPSPVATLERAAPPQPEAPQMQQAASLQAAAATGAKDDAVLAEIKHMKQMMMQLAATAASQSSAATALPEVLAKYELRLAEQEVAPELSRRLLETAHTDLVANGVELTDESVRASLVSQMVSLLQVEQENRPLAPDTRIVHFVGPTGVGKTTTIAKLAAEQVLKNRRKVGFITSDTYRIAAIEQLKTYANILNVPTEVVFSQKDLNKAFDNLQDVDIIFMDTAGRNYRNEMHVSELHTLLKSQGKSETYLVLSMTTKYRDMKAITENFSKFKLDKVIMTKMDETDSYGNILNLANDFGLSVAYIANGQNVPDDIAPFKEGRIIESILGESADE